MFPSSGEKMSIKEESPTPFSPTNAYYGTLVTCMGGFGNANKFLAGELALISVEELTAYCNENGVVVPDFLMITVKR